MTCCSATLKATGADDFQLSSQDDPLPADTIEWTREGLRLGGKGSPSFVFQRIGVEV